MSPRLIDRTNLNFLLFDWLGLEELLRRSAFAEHSRDSIAAFLDLAERLASEHFLPHYKTSDQTEPRLTVDGVEALPEIKAALQTFAEAGFFAAPFPADLDGMQVPEVVQAASMGEFMAANIATSAYAMLTIANARLLVAYGTKRQIETFARPQIAGENSWHHVPVGTTGRLVPRRYSHACAVRGGQPVGRTLPVVRQPG